MVSALLLPLLHLLFPFVILPSPDLPEMVWMYINDPHVPFGFPDLLALPLELLLVVQALLRPGLFEFLKPPLAALEKTDPFDLGLFEVV